MVRTRVGYSGGSKSNPTYGSLGDHAEAIRVVFDPARITYETLLDLFWGSHYPAERPWSRQYMSAVFHHDDGQKILAERTKEREEARTGKHVFTEILPASAFTPAEEYHQKHYLRRHPELMKEFRAVYPDFRDIVDSTAAARVNGYLGGNGSSASLRTEAGAFGLSPEGEKTLMEIVRGFESRRAPGTGGYAGCPVD